MRESKRIKPGEYGRAIMPHSEVCMHMRVAGTAMNFYVKPTEYPSVQLIREDGRYFSGGITLGEAGVLTDSEGYYYYPAETREACQQSH